jgi:hypothetical protein
LSAFGVPLINGFRLDDFNCTNVTGNCRAHQKEISAT